MINLSQNTKSKLIFAAQSIAYNAYAPYSKLYVGAAVLSASGKIYQGCNVENSSFSLTICAERNAIAQGYTVEGKNFSHLSLAITTVEKARSFPPCGACRQVMAEFGINMIILYRMQGKWIKSDLSSLLPDSFKF